MEKRLSVPANCESLADIKQADNEKLTAKIINDLWKYDALTGYNKQEVSRVFEKIVSGESLAQHEQNLLAGLNTSIVKEALVQELSKYDWQVSFGKGKDWLFTVDGENISAEKFFTLLLDGEISSNNETAVKLTQAGEDIQVFRSFLDKYDGLKAKRTVIQEKRLFLESEEKITYHQGYDDMTFTKLEGLPFSVGSQGLGVTEEQKQEITENYNLSDEDVGNMLYSTSDDLHNGRSATYAFRQRGCDANNISASTNIFFKELAQQAGDAGYVLATEEQLDMIEEAYSSAFEYGYEKGSNNSDAKLAMMETMGLYHQYMSGDKDEQNSRAFRGFYDYYCESLRYYYHDDYGRFLLLKMG